MKVVLAFLFDGNVLVDLGANLKQELRDMDRRKL